MTTKLFVIFSVLMFGLVGTATYRDLSGRDYVGVQQQYSTDHPGSTIAPGVQQLFPAYPAANIAGTFRVERCISCHVPDISQIGPDQAAKNLASDFFKYAPDAKTIQADNGLTGTHPAYIALNGNCVDPKISPTITSPAAAPSSQAVSAPASPAASASPSASASASASPSAAATPAVPATTTSAACPYSTAVDYATYGPNGTMTFTYKDYTKGVSHTVTEPGYLSKALAPLLESQTYVGIDQVGCVICHNGSRLSLSVDTAVNSPDRGAHENLIVNPTYTFTEGANLYYKNCAQCHGAQGTGDVGPPLSNQDRLGFFNEDYYYRCIEYGMTGYEHIGTLMPMWGAAPAADYVPADHKSTTAPNGVFTLAGAPLTEQQIDILTQFIRHWENYETLP